MKSARRVALEQEIREAKQRIVLGNLDRAFAHLERAHVLGQPFVGPHARVHWLMCRIELRRGRGAAVVGQFLRILLGTIGSAIGVVPVGNTGGTDIGMFQRLPLSPELQAIIDGSSPADPRG